jgi:glycogen phosphorylase
MLNKKIIAQKTKLSPEATKIVKGISEYFNTSALGLFGKDINTASVEDIYSALAYTIRKEISLQWNNTQKTYLNHDVKQVYYFSLEFLMGRMTGNNIDNISLNNSVNEALNYIKSINPNLKNIENPRNEIERIEENWGLGNGGLGRLAACFLDSAATLKLPLHGMGLWYDYGLFQQKILGGYQQEQPDLWADTASPWISKNDAKKIKIHFGGYIDSNDNKLKNYEQVEMVPFHVPIIGLSKENNPNINTLTLWRVSNKTHTLNFSAINKGDFHEAYQSKIKSDYMLLNSVLYPNDNNTAGKQLRLMQEFSLVSAGLQSIINNFIETEHNIRNLADKIGLQINDTHASLLVPELMRILLDDHNLSWDEAWTITNKTIAYTNHTVLGEALEKWDENLVKELLPRQHQIIQIINMHFCDKIRENFPNNEDKVRQMSIIEDGVIKMAHLAIVGGHTVNGVAALHTEILKNIVLKNFYELFPSKFQNVTNGVTPRRWIKQANPELASLITRLIGDNWITDLNELKKLEAFVNDENVLKELIKIKQNNKKALAEYVYSNNPIRDKDGKIVSRIEINPSSLFDVQAKRLHEYKRQLMNALHILFLFNQIKENPDMEITPRTFLFAAKAAPGYYVAKDIIKFINILSEMINNDPDVKDRIKVVFLENYNVSLAEILIPSADLSEQISTAGLEASGTGNMKFSLNGALTIGTLDGANVEMARDIGEENMFIFGLTTDEVKEAKDNGYSAWSIYDENPEIHTMIKQMQRGMIGKTPEEKILVTNLINNVMNNDNYLVLKDLASYIETQEIVASLYNDEMAWAKLSLINIARMGYFSSDRSIQEYANNIWGIQPTPVKAG